MAWTQYQTDLNSSLYPTQSQYYNCNDDSPPVYFPKEVFSSILDYCGESIENKRDRLWKKIYFKKYIPMEYRANMMGRSMEEWDIIPNRLLHILDTKGIHILDTNSGGFSQTPNMDSSIPRWPEPARSDNFTFRFNDTVLYDILDGSRDFSYNLKKKWKTLDVSTLTRSCRAVKRANRN